MTPLEQQLLLNIAQHLSIIANATTIQALVQLFNSTNVPEQESINLFKCLQRLADQGIELKKEFVVYEEMSNGQY